MREVAVLGIGQIPVLEHWEKSLRELAGQAVFAAMEDAGRETAEVLYVGNMLSGLTDAQEHLGALISDWVGLHGAESFKVEAACGSGAAAFRMALMAVASGEHDSAIAVGVEKMSENKGSEITAALATAADADYEAVHGLSFVAINALVMRRYMHEYGWQHADFAPFSVNAHANAVHNPYARLRVPISREQYQRSRMICSPINLLDSSPIGDGAAAVYLIPAEKLWPGASPIISIAASASATDTLAVHDRRNVVWLSVAESSARRAYRQAGVTPGDIDFFELHDAFSIMAVLSLEACGFAERGRGLCLGLDDQIGPTGRLPITTRGGLKARGHPVGASGIYQIVEVAQQLLGVAGPTQVSSARIGMAQNIGGSGATVLTHILRRN